MKKRIKPEPTVDMVDAHLGRRVLSRRKIRKISQSKLADKLGLSFQQAAGERRLAGAPRSHARRQLRIASTMISVAPVESRQDS